MHRACQASGVEVNYSGRCGIRNVEVNNGRKIDKAARYHSAVRNVEVHSRNAGRFRDRLTVDVNLGRSARYHLYKPRIRNVGVSNGAKFHCYLCGTSILDVYRLEDKLSIIIASGNPYRPADLSSSLGSIMKLKRKSRRLNFRLYAQGPKRSWWKEFLFQEIKGDFLGGTDVEKDERDELEMDEIDRLLADDEAFESWKQKTDAINELRQYQQMGRDPGSEDWEDWLDDSWGRDGWYQPQPAQEELELQIRRRREGVEELKKPESQRKGPFADLFQEPPEMKESNDFEKGFAKFAAISTVKFALCLVFIPWLADFAVHDYVLLPFLKRYVDLVPLAAKVFDVRDSQKLNKVIPALKDERRRLIFEAEVGIAPSLSDEELNVHLHEEALALLEEARAENRSNFANIWSDIVAGITVTLLLVFNPVQVELMSFSGNRILRNLSDIGKAFFIILLSDIFLGYHSESGWETVVEMFLEHYGMEATEGAIYTFVAIVPVTIDASFKLWVFRNLPRYSPSISATFREMQRH